MWFRQTEHTVLWRSETILRVRMLLTIYHLKLTILNLGNVIGGFTKSVISLSAFFKSSSNSDELLLATTSWLLVFFLLFFSPASVFWSNSTS